MLNLFDSSLASTSRLLPEDLRAAGDAMMSEHNRRLLAAEAADCETAAQVLLVDVHALFSAIEADPAA